MKSTIKHKFYFLIIGLAFFAHQSTIAAEKIISVATLDDYAPYCFPKSNGANEKNFETIPPGQDATILQGYSWDVLRSSLHEMGYTIVLVVYPWVRSLDRVKSGQEDLLFPTGWTKERSEFFYFSREDINKSNFIVYVRKDSSITWKGLNSLNGLVIAAVRGWNYGGEWKTNHLIQKYDVNTIEQGFLMLDKNRVDGFAGYEINFDYVLKQNGWSSNYDKLPEFGFTNEFLAGSKRNPDVLPALDAFDEGRRRINENGEFKRIVAKWRGE